jgi:hypothetical protein
MNSDILGRENIEGSSDTVGKEEGNPNNQELNKRIK